MECKWEWELSLLQTEEELIDTLWNVNDEVYGEACRYDEELIDTLWNVNIIR